MIPDKNIFTDRDPDSLSELYHVNTKLNRWNGRKYGERIGAFNRSYENLMTVFKKPGKVYARAPSMTLPSVSDSCSIGIRELIAIRRSAKAFGDQEINLEQLAFALQCSAGVTDPTLFLRSYPSAGAMYPLEVYVAIFSVRGCDQGLYHYSVYENSLRRISVGDYRARLSKVLLMEDLAEKASAAIVLSAIFHRAQIKYGERGYRMILFEAGHLAQNLLLAATAQRMAAVPVGGFMDDELNEILGLDGIEESALYPLLLGTLHASA